MLATIWRWRIVVTIMLLFYPLSYVTYKLWMFFVRWIKLVRKKIEEVVVLDKMRKELLDKKVQETVEKQIIFDENERGEVTLSSEKTTLHEWKESMIDHDHNTTISPEQKEVIVNESMTMKEEIAPSQPSPIQKHRQSRLLEKIKHDAITCKEKWHFELYEKKLIEWLAIDQENLTFMKMLADRYFHSSNYKKALSLLKKVLELKDDDHTAMRQIGEIYLERGEFDTAELLIEKAIALKPNNPKYYVSMVEIAYNTKRYQEAISLMEKVVRLRPSNISYMLAIADLYEEQKEESLAKKYYFKVLEIEPTNKKARQKIQSL